MSEGKGKDNGKVGSGKAQSTTATTGLHEKSPGVGVAESKARWPPSNVDRSASDPSAFRSSVMAWLQDVPNVNADIAAQRRQE